MADVILTTNTSTGQQLNTTGDIYFLAEGVTHYATATDEPLQLVDSGTPVTRMDVIIEGTLASLGNFGAIHHSSSNDVSEVSISIGSSGSVLANSSYRAIDIDAHQAQITNNGEIIGGEAINTSGDNTYIVNNGFLASNYETTSTIYAVNVLGENNEIVNNGEITGRNGIEVWDNTEIINTGSISATGTAIKSTLSSSESNILTNTGIISGSTAYSSLFGNDTIINSGHINGNIIVNSFGSNSLQNSGLITGDIEGNFDSGILLNSGTISGNLTLGIGNETFNGRGGTVSGSVAGGSGDDTYIVDSVHDLVENASEGTDTVRSYIDWNLGDNFENLTLLGGDDLDGNGNALANILTGNAGDNSLNGEDGDDFIYGGNGGDEIRGGVGLDTIEGGNGDDHIRGQDGADDIEGGKGDDHIRGGRGDDKILGQAGDDYLRGGGGNDDIKGHSGHDTLRGGEGDDTLNGQDGNDILIGGLGQDTLEGGSGIDTFVFNAIQHSPNGSTADVILDFVSGTDLIDLSGLNGDLTFIGSNSFSATGGAEVRFVVGGSDTLIRVDLDGNGTSDMKITLDGVTSDIAVSDLVL